MTVNIVPRWMKVIMDNPSLLAEFMQDLNQRANSANQEGVKQFKEGNFHIAAMHIGKSEAYASLRNAFTINLSESEEQHAFQSQSQTTGSSGKRTRQS